MTFNDPLDFLVDHIIEFRDQPTPGFFDQKVTIIADFPGKGGEKTLFPSNWYSISIWMGTSRSYWDSLR